MTFLLSPKIVEKGVQNQLIDHSIVLTTPNTPKHLWKFYFTETTILDLWDNILINMENNQNTAIATLVQPLTLTITTYS